MRKHRRLKASEMQTLCPTKVLRELSLYKNYDKFSFRLCSPLKRWILSRGGASYVRRLILEDLKRRALEE
ncbi:hypothetical protein J7K27_02995 [Candidatus Bathyarchaeota archaeon]|nr:hypothetical protein [Candidatus Bathyarchaeota archaeon]